MCFISAKVNHFIIWSLIYASYLVLIKLVLSCITTHIDKTSKPLDLHKDIIIKSEVSSHFQRNKGQGDELGRWMLSQAFHIILEIEKCAV
jgi:hypothetical protein